MSFELTQTTLRQSVEMALDKSSMQCVNALFEGVTTAGVIMGGNARTSCDSSGTIDGSLTTIDADTGEITVGRTGDFELSLAGSVKSSIASSTKFTLIVQLSTDGGTVWTEPGPRVERDLSSTDYGSFAAAFSGARNAGDMLRVSLVSSATADFTFASYSVLMGWMS